MTIPFTYPAVPHVRRHGPQGYADHESYRPWVREEFAFRCVYCLMREQWGLVRGTFALDHFEAMSVRPDRVGDYDNLLYTCVTCNETKRVTHEIRVTGFECRRNIGNLTLFGVEIVGGIKSCRLGYHNVSAIF